MVSLRGGACPDANEAVHGLARGIRHAMAGFVVAENSDGDAVKVPPAFCFRQFINP